jgi:HK97 family phage major capsid protein
MNWLEKIRQYLKRKNELKSSYGKVLEQADKETRDLTKEEEESLEEIEKEMESLKRSIARAEKMIEMEKETASSVEETDEDEPESRSLENIEIGDQSHKYFRSFGEQMKAVVVAGKTRNAQVDPRLENVRKKHEAELRAEGMSTSIPSDGGFLVQPEYANTLMQRANEYGEILSRCDKVSLSRGNTYKVPYVEDDNRQTGNRWGGVQAYWLNEAGKLTKSKPQFGEWECSVQKLGALVYLTDEMMEDSPALGQFVERAYRDEMGFTMQDAVMHGNGVGKPLGFLQGKDLILVPKEAGQAAASVVAQNIINMWARMLPSSRKNAVWLINVELEPLLMQMYIKTGDNSGQLLYMPAGGLNDAPYGRIFGRPVIPVEQASQAGTVGDISLVDLKNYLIVDRSSPKMDSSIHVEFLTDQLAFRFIQRVNGKSKFKSPVTPYKGSKTLGTFISLAARG